MVIIDLLLGQAKNISPPHSMLIYIYVYIYIYIYIYIITKLY